MTPMVIFL